MTPDPLTPSPDSPTPLVDAAFVEYPVMDTQKGGDAITIQAARNIERQLRSKNAALRKVLEALYHYEARRSSPDTAWEQPMMSNARKALGL